MKATESDVPPEQYEEMSEFASELFTFLIESGLSSDPNEATVMASAFCMLQYERGWLFGKTLNPIAVEKESEECTKSSARSVL